MTDRLATAQDVAGHVLAHLLRRVAATPALDDPFGHFYLEDAFPADVYTRLLAHLPDPGLYGAATERHHKGEYGGTVRSRYDLSAEGVDQLPGGIRELWRGVAAALTAPKLKEAVFARLAPDLAYRYGVSEAETAGLTAYARPTLYRETDGFEIPPHPDTRKKVVTMHFYLPADDSQLDLGTALYRRRVLAWPVGGWRQRFAKVKQFAFRPNSGYAFVVNNTLMKRSWHGRERLPAGAGVRNTLLNTFYTEHRAQFGGYFDSPPAAAPLRRAA